MEVAVVVAVVVVMVVVAVVTVVMVFICELPSRETTQIQMELVFNYTLNQSSQNV